MERKIKYTIPSKVIVPIVQLDERKNVINLLGTGFFLENFSQSNEFYIITAKHIFSDINDNDQIYFSVPDSENIFDFKPIKKVLLCEKNDIALCLTEERLKYRSFCHFLDDKLPQNIDIFTIEYSTSFTERSENKINEYHFIPLSHKGYVTRYIPIELSNENKFSFFETSFPALRGASGAPIFMMHKSTVIVVGMLVGNFALHLIPAQTESYFEGSKSVEDIKYYLPFGRAIEAPAIINFLKLKEIYHATVTLDNFNRY